MLIVLSHANNVESCQVDEDYAHSIMYTLDTMDSSKSLLFSNYSNIGGDVEVTAPELRRKVRFYFDGQQPFINSLSYDPDIMYDFLDALESLHHEE